jgi:lipopolysaccharide transport system ATP-binding protein
MANARFELEAKPGGVNGAAMSPSTREPMTATPVESETSMPLEQSAEGEPEAATSQDDWSVRVSNLSKVFKVYARPRDMLLELVLGPRHKPFWALRDINITIARGDKVGIVGRNGSGKSTLLKIIAGTLDHTSGTVEVRGKISAILELGVGVNPAYSGRENIYFGGLCYGMSKEDIRSKIDAIIEFSELKEVIDQPFSTYSSGMKARLLFSTALHVNPELLIIDEALATGDAGFVSKSLRHVERLSENSDLTAIFVSHSMNHLLRLCNRGIYLNAGQVMADGPIRDVVAAYENELMRNDEESIAAHQERERAAAASSGHHFHLRVTAFRTRSGGVDTDVLYTGEPAELVIEYESDVDVDEAWVGLELYHGLEGAFVATLNNRHHRGKDFSMLPPTPIRVRQGKGAFIFQLDPLILGHGGYFVHFSVFPLERVLARAFGYHEAVAHVRYVGTFHVSSRTELYVDRIQIVDMPHRIVHRQ